MALPSNFNGFEHLQDTIRRVQNLIVRDEFFDVGGDSFAGDISTGRASLRTACTLQDDDSADMLQMRLWLFYIILKKAKDLHPNIYGIPTTAFQASRKFKPQIELYFLEDVQDVATGYNAVAGEISFRLMNETSKSISTSQLTLLGNKIKQFFATPSFVWKKGKELYSYADWNRGYQLQQLCRNETEARRVVSSVLSIQNHNPEWKRLKLNKATNESEAFPTIPESEVILGKSRKLPRTRPIADVRFQYGALHLHGLPNPICLFDRSYTFPNPVVKV